MNIIIHLDKDRGKNCIKVCECFDLQQCIILLFKMNVLALADFLVTSLWVLFSLQYGPVFSFTMVGKTFTYLLGSEAAALLFNSKNEDLNAEDVYSRLTTPVFGKGVAYDVPNPVGDTVSLKKDKSTLYNL